MMIVWSSIINIRSSLHFSHSPAQFRRTYQNWFVHQPAETDSETGDTDTDHAILAVNSGQWFAVNPRQQNVVGICCGLGEDKLRGRSISETLMEGLWEIKERMAKATPTVATATATAAPTAAEQATKRAEELALLWVDAVGWRFGEEVWPEEWNAGWPEKEAWLAKQVGE